MTHVCSFSTGLSSAVMTERVIARYGPESVTVVFMDTRMEHEDNLRFQGEVYGRWLAHGLPPENIVTLTEGRNPYEVSEDHHMIANQRRHPCTYDLKITPFMKWLKQHDPAGVTIHIGIDFSEFDRKAAIVRNYGKAGYTVDFPLLWKPIEHRPYAEVARQDWNIEPPIMYDRGYSHANCGGRCVAQGIGDWLRTLIYDRPAFLEVEAWEREMRTRPGLDRYAICRDQSNGQVKPRTLQDIRETYEARPVMLPLFEQVACVQCGIGDFIA